MRCFGSKAIAKLPLFVVLEGQLEVVHPRGRIRGPELADSMSRYLIERLEEAPSVTLRRRTRVLALEGGQHLERVTWRDDATGEVSVRAVRHLFSMTGASPSTAWLNGCVALDTKGFVRTGADLDADTLGLAGWPLGRAPHLFETSRLRIFELVHRALRE